MTTISELKETVEYTKSLTGRDEKLSYLYTRDRSTLNFLSGNIKMDGIAKTIASEIPISELNVSISDMDRVIDAFDYASKISGKIGKIQLMKQILLSPEDREFVLTCLYGSLKLGIKVPIPDPIFGESIKCQLCGTGIEFDPVKMVIETKWDGIRCLATNNNGEIILQSRNGKVLNVPVIARSLKNILPSGTTVDGEIVDKTGDFQKLDRKSNDLIYMIFDIIFVDSQPIINIPLKDRLVILRNIIKENNYIKISQELDLNTMNEINEYIESTGVEGIVAKDPNSLYIYNNRKAWIKVKLFKECTATVISYNLGEGKRTGTVGSINIIPENSDVITKCGSGFEDKDLDYMKDLIDNDNQILVNIKFQNYTTAGCLRFPIFMNIRSINGKESLE